MRKLLNREELKGVINGAGCCSNVPILYDMWIFPENFEESRRPSVEQFIKEHPGDAVYIDLHFPEMYEAPSDDPNYKWAADFMVPKTGVGLDAAVVAEEWEDMEEIYKNFPSPDYPGLIPQKKETGGRYVIARWCFLLFERLWSLRGMENALTDLYLYPDEVHRLFEKLTEFYIRVLERVKHELDADGIFVTDDIGTQTSPFFSLDIFREFFKPYYKKIIDKAHELGMHFWLHSCGNIELFFPDLIEIGLDVIHPIQKHAMKEEEISKKYGDKICLLVGFDVQQTIPYGTEEEVRAEARRLIDSCARKDGRFMLTFGNGSTNDWKLERLEALYDETCRYGEKVFRKFGQEG